MNAPEAPEIWRELVRASVDRRHPWRVVSFCTQSEEDGPQARSVILRQAKTDERLLLFYTDARTRKLRDLAACPRVALLMWDGPHRRQLRLWGSARRLEDQQAVDLHWARVPEAGQRDYATVLPPGTPLPQGEGSDADLSPAVARSQFVVLAVEVDRMEWLELRREGHRRTALNWGPEGAWSAQSLVP